MMMNNKGIGIDIVEIDRFAKSIDRFGDNFLNRLFTKNEILYCKKHNNFVFRFAGRYAAKEAVVKAIGTGIGKKISWKDIEIANDENGKPFVHLSKKANELFNNPNIMISISHNNKSAIAVAFTL